MTTTEKISALSERIEAKKSDLARAQAAFEAAEESHNKALARLSEEFKVTSPEEAKKLLEKLRKKADKLYDKALEVLGD